MKMKKKNIFSFFDTKNFLVYVVRGQFSEKSWKKFKKKIYQGLDEIKTKIVKKFGVHICILQRTAGDQYQGGANLAPPLLSQPWSI